MKLQHRSQDFRDLLPKLDKTIFEHEICPSKLWKSLGNEYNFKQWRRILRRYRVDLKISETLEYDVVWGEYYTEEKIINLFLIEPKKHPLYVLKFRLIQTLMHEMIHAHQFFSHSDQCWKLIEKQETEVLDYMSTFGEIDAFAHCIVLEHLENKTELENAYRLYDGVTPKVRKLLIKRMWRWMQIYS